jgi:hypothetical protein
MHKKYGPVVRIMPNVVHVNDPSFIEQLYPQSPQLRRERAQTFLNFFNEYLSMLPTRDHQLHRQRSESLLFAAERPPPGSSYQRYTGKLTASHGGMG